jgi:UDP-N-acetylglucosamine 2-epimerase (non-hydrolysing)
LLHVNNGAMKKIAVIMGTRPEAIKLCPLVLELRKNRQCMVDVCTTGQHRAMIDQVLDVFGIVPDTDLNLMEPDQSLAGLTSRAIIGIDRHLKTINPDLVIVQGDTTTAFCGALAAFYNKIDVGHVEAGLRTYQAYAPFPEEINRVLITRIARWHFAPTEASYRNLIAEGIPENRVFITGNTGVDALFSVVDKVKSTHLSIPGVPEGLLAGDRPLILITSHRRENVGNGFEKICGAIADLSCKFSEVAFVYPVHLNPNIREPVFRMLSGRDNVFLIEPVGYLPFVALMMRSTIILTDSGGIQEEAPSLGIPVVVMRETTERPEAVEAGVAVLAGVAREKIVAVVSRLMIDKEKYAAMAKKVNPFGDGEACGRIVEIIGKNYIR